LDVSWLLTTTILLRVILPALLTLPLKVRTPPGLAGFVGQFSRTTMAGVLCKVQVAEAVAVATTPAQVFVPRAVTELVTVQALAGEVKVAVKLAEAPGARLASVKTVLGEAWASITVTLLSVTLPGLL